ncbi:hypothetical protein C8R43DRAFT_34716 [Mycena crocata]|nr:hypothetical protein C8R43DRAFT_34716 [Mycena crocata]
MPLVHYRRQLGNPFSGLFGHDDPTTTAHTTTASASATTPVVPTTTSALVFPYYIHHFFEYCFNPHSRAQHNHPFSNNCPCFHSYIRFTIRIVTSEKPEYYCRRYNRHSRWVIIRGFNHFILPCKTRTVLHGGELTNSQRRWNRHRSRTKARESIKFSPDEFRRSAMVLGDGPATEQKYTEQKYTSMASYQYPAEAYRPEAAYSPHMQQQYSPQPYPSAAQQVVYAYQGVKAPQQQYGSSPYDGPEQRPNSYPNPHPIAPVHRADNTENAYGGM